ncbi:MAG: glutamate dehydrogenase, partial [Chitinophagaceae bacterium]|nr:glutamate dehydrogenase [Chitinophagaceae bacterium]
MNINYRQAVQEFLDWTQARNIAQPEFMQAVSEVANAVIPFIEDHPEYKEARILQRMTEAERIFIFRVPWVDDKGVFQINRGYRVQMNSAIGPYKGG